MAHTLLLEPVSQLLMIIGGETIRNQHSLELFAQNLDHHFVRATFLKGVDGHLPVGEYPQPSRQGTNAPTRLIYRSDSALTNGPNQFLVNRAGFCCQPLGVTFSPKTELISSQVFA